MSICQQDIDRFWPKVDIKSFDECWLWMAYEERNGYGVFRFNKKIWKAHRFSYLLHYGSIPNQLFILHKYDERLCVNPNHLFAGTNSDNMQDMISKGRNNHLFGNKHPNSKLTDEQVLTIIEKYKSGKTMQDLATEYNITVQAISQNIRGNLRKHLQRPNIQLRSDKALGSKNGKSKFIEDDILYIRKEYLNHKSMKKLSE